MKRLFFIAVIILLLVVYVLKPTLQYFFPIDYLDLIVEVGNNYDVDPLLIAALIKVESDYNPEAISPKGAVGLMQIMPDTGRWVADQNRKRFKPDDLKEPEININYGVYYLAKLMGEFPTEHAALAAYNAGPTIVHQWVDWYVWDATFESRIAIPYQETRSYLKKVEFTKRFYHYLYKDELEHERS